MSITYQIYFEKALEIEQFCSQIQSTLKLNLSFEKQQNGYAIVGIPDLEASFYSVKKPQNDFIEEDHGFVPSDCINFRLNKTNLEQSQNQLVSLFCACLTSYVGSILALREQEGLVFHSKNKYFEVNYSDALWHKRSRKVRFQAFLKRRVVLPIVEQPKKS